MSRIFFSTYPTARDATTKSLMVLSAKMRIFFQFFFSKDPSLGTNCLYFNPKCPFLHKIPLNQSKKWFGEKKMGVTHHLLGIWPQKHSRSSLQQLKTHFGVNSPLFQLKHPVLFSCNVINQLRNISREKNVGVPYQKMGIWPT